MIERLANFFQSRIEAAPWPESFSLPRYQMHRGYCQTGLQENTLGAFRAAQQGGALMFECDVQLSADKVPVVFHDWDLLRLAGRSEKVCELTAAELGRWAGVSTLHEVLRDKLVPALVNIELKTKSSLNESLERRVAEVVINTASEGRVMFSSFNPVSVWKISKYLPQAPRALLVAQDMDEDNAVYLRDMWLAPFLRLQALHLQSGMISAQLMEMFGRKNISIVAWTVNDPTEAERLFALGVKSIISDVLF